jgi:hypothetical protein
VAASELTGRVQEFRPPLRARQPFARRLRSSGRRLFGRSWSRLDRP